MDSQDKLLRFVLVFLLLYATAALSAAGRELSALEAEKAGLVQRLSALEAEKAQMAQRLREGLSDEELIQLARQRLGLVLPGEKIFYFTDREA